MWFKCAGRIGSSQTRGSTHRMGEGTGSSPVRTWPPCGPRRGLPPGPALNVLLRELRFMSERTDGSAFSHASCSRGHTTKSSAFRSSLCHTVLEERSCERRIRETEWKPHSPRFEWKVSGWNPVVFCLTKWRVCFWPRLLKRGERVTSSAAI